jgi:hypothetical protein
VLILQRPWSEQPQGAVEIDWGNPLSVGLAVAHNLLPGNLVNPVNGSRSSINGTSAFAASPVGLGFANDQNSFIDVPGLGDFQSAPGYSCLLLANLGTPDNYAAIWAKQSSSGSNSFQLQKEGASDQLTLNNDTAGISFTSGGPFAPSKFQNRFAAIGLTWGAPAGVGYVDGVFAEQVFMPTAPGFGTASLKIGAARDSTTLAWGGTYVFFAAWRRTLSAQEMASVSRNPWQLFQPRRVYIPTATAGATVPTLSASTYVTGSLTSTGWRPQVTAS